MQILKNAVKAVFLSGFLAVLALVPAAQAQDSLKIGVVQFQRLMAEAPQVQAAQAKLEDEFAPRQRELQAMETEYRVKAAQIEKNLAVMGADEREAAQRELRDEERAIVRAQNEFREDGELRQNEILRGLQQELALTAQEFGQKEGYDLILFDGILHASEKVDVTQQVLALLKDKAK